MNSSGNKEAGAMSWTVSYTDTSGTARLFQARVGMAVVLSAHVCGEDFSTSNATITRNDPAWGMAGFMITYPGDARWIRDDWLTEITAAAHENCKQP